MTRFIIQSPVSVITTTSTPVASQTRTASRAFDLSASQSNSLAGNSPPRKRQKMSDKREQYPNNRLVNEESVNSGSTGQQIINQINKDELIRLILQTLDEYGLK